jgi:hypothetical protein
VYDLKNRAVRAYGIRLLHCPSSPHNSPQKDPGGIDVGASSYAGCHHHAEAPIHTTNSGVLYLNSSIRYEQITDGSSYTIFVGELLLPPNTSMGWMSGTPATLRNTGSDINVELEGLHLRAAGGGAPAPAPNAVGGFGSHHAGGAHFLIGDGSVRFLSQNIDRAMYQAMGNRASGELIGDF